MAMALSREALNKNTRGDGGSRKSGDDFQVMFSCAVFKELIVAGRRPVVKQADILRTLVTPSGGAVLIAKVGLHISVQGQTSIALAAFGTSSPKRSVVASWGTVAAALEHRCVRLMAGEFGDTLFTLLAATRKRMAVKVCAMRLATDNDDGASVLQPSGYGRAGARARTMLVAGPVGRITIFGDLR